MKLDSAGYTSQRAKARSRESCLSRKVSFRTVGIPARLKGVCEVSQHTTWRERGEDKCRVLKGVNCVRLTPSDLLTESARLQNPAGNQTILVLLPLTHVTTHVAY
jgi:hypothetical protein